MNDPVLPVAHPMVCPPDWNGSRKEGGPAKVAHGSGQLPSLMRTVEETFASAGVAAVTGLGAEERILSRGRVPIELSILSARTSYYSRQLAVRWVGLPIPVQPEDAMLLSPKCSQRLSLSRSPPQYPTRCRREAA